MKEQGKIEKFQIQARPNKRISINDALTNSLFSRSVDDWARLLDGKEEKFLEANTKKHGVIESHYWLKFLDDERVKLSEPLDELDRDIFDACISAQVFGNPCITLREIWREITGNQNSNTKPTPDWKKEISERVDKLARLRLTVDLSVACEKKIYRDGTKYRMKANLLPCEIIEAEINGQICESVIIFNGESPLLKIAHARSGKKKQAAQILTYSSKALGGANRRNTPTTTAISNYLLRRIKIAKAHSNTARTILLSTLFERCGLDNVERWQKQDVCKIIEAVMKSFVEEREIESFEFIKERGKFTKITFNFNHKMLQKQRK